MRRRAEGASRRARRRRRAGAAADRAAHVGYHLVDAGRPDARSRRSAIRPRLAPARPAPPLRATRRPCYLGSIARADRADGRRRRSSTRSHGRVPACDRGCRRRCSLLLPASELAIASSSARDRRARRPAPAAAARLRRAACPTTARTMVIVPTLLHERRSASTTLVEHLEVLALGNLDPCIHFAHPQRLRRRARRRDVPGRRGDPRRGARRRSRR